MEANEVSSITESNKEYFNKDASTYDTHPTRVLCAKKCAEAILKEIKDPEGYEVMDFACGTVDLSQNMVDEYNKKVSQQGIDKEEMQAICLELKESEGDQLNGRKFDLVVCASAYHHIDDVESVTRVLASYLKQGGELIVLDLKKQPEHSHMFHGGGKDHMFHSENRDHILSHKGGFFPEELEKIFLATGMLENVSSKVAFNLSKKIEKDEHTFEWLLVKGKKI
ncbi:7086_t:CDS:2 [Dentiscutata erythropus]|uniref:7086_t:CDS:1 n=1 Tax=Dentiscutata erythropus TaxID=1348616 RepID=A0A9N9IAW9_9GLOM|nr:7086_t:CDS:2 [Dentiscutata erythropus]